MNIDLYNEIENIFNDSGILERQLALNIDEFIPFSFNLGEDSILYIELGIHNIIWTSRFSLEFHTDYRILQNKNIFIVKMFIEKYDLTIYIDELYDIEKLKSYSLILFDFCPVYTLIDNSEFKISLYARYIVSDMYLFKSWLVSGISCGIHQVELNINVYENNVEDVYSFLVYLHDYYQDFGNFNKFQVNHFIINLKLKGVNRTKLNKYMKSFADYQRNHSIYNRKFFNIYMQ